MKKHYPLPYPREGWLNPYGYLIFQIVFFVITAGVVVILLAGCQPGTIPPTPVDVTPTVSPSPTATQTQTPTPVTPSPTPITSTPTYEVTPIGLIGEYRAICQPDADLTCPTLYADYLLTEPVRVMDTQEVITIEGLIGLCKPKEAAQGWQACATFDEEVYGIPVGYVVTADGEHYWTPLTGMDFETGELVGLIPCEMQGEVCVPK